MNLRFIPIALMMAMTLGPTSSFMRELQHNLGEHLEQSLGQYYNDVESFLPQSEIISNAIVSVEVGMKIYTYRVPTQSPRDILAFCIMMEGHYNSTLDRVNRDHRRILPFYQKQIGLMYRVYEGLLNDIQSADATIEALIKTSRLHFDSESLRLQEAGDAGIRLLCPEWPIRISAAHRSLSLSNIWGNRLSSCGARVLLAIGGLVGLAAAFGGNNR